MASSHARSRIASRILMQRRLSGSLFQVHSSPFVRHSGFRKLQNSNHGCTFQAFSSCHGLLLRLQNSTSLASLGFTRNYSWWGRNRATDTGNYSQFSNELDIGVKGKLDRTLELNDRAGECVAIDGQEMKEELSVLAASGNGCGKLLPEVFETDTSASIAQGGVDEVIAQGVAGIAIWSLLRAPADGVVALVDGVHTAVGGPWWLTIIGSTLAFRAIIFPFTVMYLKKASQFSSAMPQLPPIFPLRGSGKSYAEQYRIFSQRRLELRIPSPLWAFAGLLQAPLFIYWIIALRGMAMAPYPGFDSGGALWFVDLTVPVHGSLGGLFPSLMALTYVANIYVSFRVMKPKNDLTNFFLKIYKWWLEAMTVPLFIMGFYLPQGVYMYWLTNNCCNLSQSLVLQHNGLREKLGLPLLPKVEDSNVLKTPKSQNNVQVAQVDELIFLASKFVVENRDDEAVKLLERALEKDSDAIEAYNVLGMLHVKKKQWSEALEFYNLAISKATKDEHRITSFMGAGIALHNQGRNIEAIDVMRPLTKMRTPQDPLRRQKYLRALVTLASALSQEGLKSEALSVLQLAAKWDQSVDRYIDELKKTVGS